MPEVLTGCPVGDTFNGAHNDHCYCSPDNRCCYCRMPIEEARMMQQVTPTLTAQQYQARYVSQRYTQANWFIDEPTATTNTLTWGTTTTPILGQSQQVSIPITWTPITDGLAASDAILENLIFSPITDDDGSEEIKD